MNHTEQLTAPIEPITQATKPDWSWGWRYEIVQTGKGREESRRIPLTPEEARHPKEGYVMPERTEHEVVSGNVGDMLHGKFEKTLTMAIYRNLVFEWDNPEIGTYAPDVAVVPNVRDPDANRGQFVVANEGTRPILAIEVVSLKSRRTDRVDKVRDYELLGIQEYVYIDIRRRHGQIVGELVGYRLQANRYVPILPDEDDALYLESVNCRIGLDGNQVWMEDGDTGENLLNNVQAQRALKAEKQARQAAEARIAEEETARQTAEIRAGAEEAARRAADARIAELEALVQALRQQGDQRYTAVGQNL